MNAALIVGEAQAALALGEQSSNNNVGGDARGRSYTHWSQYCLFAGAVIAAVAAIATAILASYAITVVCGALCVIDIIGTCYLRQLGQLKTFGALTASLANKVHVQFENFKTQQALDEQIRTELEQKSAATSHELETVVDKLKAAEEIYEKLSKGHTESLQTAEQTAHNVQKFLIAEGQFNEEIAHLGNYTKPLNDEEAQLQNTVASMISVKNMASEEDVKLNKTLTLITEQFNHLQTLCQTKNEMIKALQKQEKNFQDVITDFKTEIQALHNDKAAIQWEDHNLKDDIAFQQEKNKLLSDLKALLIKNRKPVERK